MQLYNVPWVQSRTNQHLESQREPVTCTVKFSLYSILNSLSILCSQLCRKRDKRGSLKVKCLNKTFLSEITLIFLSERMQELYSDHKVQKVEKNLSIIRQPIVSRKQEISFCIEMNVSRCPVNFNWILITNILRAH